MNSTYCDKCNKIVEYKTMITNKKRIVDNLIVEYEQKKDICRECNNEFYTEDSINYNILSYTSAYNKIFEPITVEEINKILVKYNIGKKPLANLLNWGEITIIRYLNGHTPNKMHSDILKSILNSPIIMEKYLIRNKDRISNLTYKKVYSKIKQVEYINSDKKIYIVANYILNKMEDITPLSLQKLLYFIQGFSSCLLDKNIFEDKCEAWINGPVYNDIYIIYNSYSINKYTQDVELNKLSIKEKKLIDEIINSFGCYSGNTLKLMTHETDPWKKSRKNLDDGDSSKNKIDINSIKNYFNNILNKHEITKIEEISKYSDYLFHLIKNK